MEIFKKKDNTKYKEIITETMKERQQAFVTMQKEIEDYLEMGEGTLDASMEYWSEFPEKKKLFGEAGRMEKMKAQVKLPITQERQAVIEALKFSMKCRFDAEKTLEKMRKDIEGRDPVMMRSINQHSAVESIRTDDNLFAKFGFGSTHLERCAEYFQLRNNPEIMEFKQNMIKGHYDQKREQMDTVRPSKEHEQKLRTAAQNHGFPEMKGEKILPWEYMREAAKIIYKFVQIQLEENQAKLDQNRRIVLKNGNQERYSQIVSRQSQHRKQVENVNFEIFFVQLGISKDVFEKSREAHFNEPLKAESYRAAVMEGTSQGKSQSYKELSREKVLEFITDMQQEKCMGRIIIMSLNQLNVANS